MEEEVTSMESGFILPPFPRPEWSFISDMWSLGTITSPSSLRVGARFLVALESEDFSSSSEHGSTKINVFIAEDGKSEEIIIELCVLSLKLLLVLRTECCFLESILVLLLTFGDMVTELISSPDRPLCTATRG